MRSWTRRGRTASTDRLVGVFFVETPQEPDQDTSGSSRFTLEFFDGALRFTLSNRGQESDGRQRWEYELDGAEELIRLLAHQLGGGTISFSL